MIRQRLLHLICFISIGFYGHAQVVLNLNTDSVLKLIPAAKEDTIKAKLYLTLGKYYERTDPKNATKYYLLAGELSKKASYAAGIFRYYGGYSNILNQQGLFDSALAITLESVEWGKKLKDSIRLAEALLNTGISYAQLHEYEIAIQYIEEGRDIIARSGNLGYEGSINDLLQNLARMMHQYRKGVGYGLVAVEKLEQAGNTSLLCAAANNLGLNYIYLQQYDSAKYYLDKASVIAIAEDDVMIKLCNNLNYGYIFLRTQDLDSAKPYLEKALDLSHKKGMYEYEGLALWGISIYYLSKKEYAVSKKHADSAMILAYRYNMRDLKQKVLGVLSDLAFSMQDTKLGIYYNNQYELLTDSILNESVIKNTISIEKKYETAKKEAQIQLQQAQLKQKSILNYLLIAGSVALLAISLLTYRIYKNRQKLQQQRIAELETEKQLSTTEAVLKGEEQERTRLAKDLHDGLGGMLSGIKYSLSNIKENLVMTPGNAQAFARSIDMLDTSISEMRRVAHNMMPEILLKYGLDTALREFCNEIDKSSIIHASYHSINMDKVSIEQTTALTIYRIVQELINNALRHAAAKHVLLQVHVLEEEKLLAVTVEDDGKGFDTATLQQSQGMGWNNIQNRVEFLKGEIDIKSAPGNGTSVLIEIDI